MSNPTLEALRQKEVSLEADLRGARQRCVLAREEAKKAHQHADWLHDHLTQVQTAIRIVENLP